jgi:hypothetical protein
MSAWTQSRYGVNAVTYGFYTFMVVPLLLVHQKVTNCFMRHKPSNQNYAEAEEIFEKLSIA